MFKHRMISQITYDYFKSSRLEYILASVLSTENKSSFNFCSNNVVPHCSTYTIVKGYIIILEVVFFQRPSCQSRVRIEKVYFIGTLSHNIKCNSDDLIRCKVIVF